MRGRLSILVVVALFTNGAGADLLWDNGLVPNGFSGRAISPPNFPNIRVTDDFTVGSVTVQDAHFNVIEDAEWVAPENITVEIYADTGRGPGDIIATHVGPFTRMETGDIYFGRTNYDYWVEGMNIDLDGGTYWIGVRNPPGGGGGTNFWLTSDGGRDGPDSDTGWFSLDAGNTWRPEGPKWHYAFTVTGIPEPSTCLLLGLGGLVLLRRRR